MSIKTIDTESVGTDTGISKKINRGAEKLVFDILQSTQYSTPIPSTVRELVTNACDSQREKEIAIEILTGAAEVEDYYIERHGEQYEDSNFNREYYDLNYLSSNSKVEIVYKKNEGVGFCDTFSITDHGVGIGGRRLEGVLELGYSTKRNTSQSFGAFGLGAKVALSTGVEYYTIETVYCGKRFKVNCYSYKTEFVIPKFNPSSGQVNPSITLSDGSIVYYEPVSHDNFTTVSFGVKKHNYQRFRDAISEQLTYFNNVDFTIINEHDVVEKVHFNVPILYNSDTLIVSESYYFNKPHIVIVKDVKSNNGINYGHIDFKELEMEQLYGAIGLKCPIKQSYINENGESVVIQDGVEVTPSREKVIWNDSTKEYIQKIISTATDEVTGIVESELQETDFIKWIGACKDVLYNTTRSNKVDESKRTILSVLSNIIDTTGLKPKYVLNDKVKFGSIGSLFSGFKLVRKEIVRNVNKGVSGTEKSISIAGKDLEDWSSLDISRLYVSEESISKLKDYHLITTHGDHFFLLYPRSLDYLTNKITSLETSDVDRAVAEHEYKKLLANQQLILPLLKSSELYRNYDEIEVPEGVSLSLIKEEELTEQDIRQFGVHESPEERRARNSAIVAHGIRIDNKYRGPEKVWDKVEPILNDVILSETPTYYATGENSELLMEAFSLCENRFPFSGTVFNTYYSSASITYWDSIPKNLSNNAASFRVDGNGSPVKWNKAPQLLKVSQTNLKHLQLNKHAKPIEEFFYDVTDDGALTAHPIVRMAVTKMMFDKISDVTHDSMWDDLSILRLQGCHPIFHSLNLIVSCLYNYRQEVIPQEYLTLYSKWGAFQKASKDVKSDEELEDLSSQLLLFSDIKKVDIYDEELLEILLYIRDIYLLVNPLLTSISHPDSISKVTTELDFYIRQKGLYDIPLPGKCSTLNELQTVVETKLNILR